MPDDETEPPLVLKVSPRDSTSVLIELLVELKASLGALTVLLIEIYADSDEEAVAMAKRNEKTRQSLLLEYAFLLQDKYPTKPEDSS